MVLRGRLTGTHLGPFMGMPPTGRPIEVPVMDVLRVEDGPATEHWGMTDTMVMMQQLGALPADG